MRNKVFKGSVKFKKKMFFSAVHGKRITIPDGEMYRTPYGARIYWALPGGNKLVVHLKDKNKIRRKKRWSQVSITYNS